MPPLRAILLVLLHCSIAPAVEQLAPGLHRRQACAGGSWTCDILVPAAAEGALPGLFLSSPGGNPDVGRWKPWADRNGFLIVGLNDSRNGIDEEIIARMQRSPTCIPSCVTAPASAVAAGAARVSPRPWARPMPGRW
jgi:hypothetical protein